MTINNINILLPLMQFDNPDEFYHVQILKRKKENPELGSNSYVVKTYYVSSEQYLIDKMPEIINLCDFNNARAYLNLSPRSFEKTAFNTMKKVCDCIMNKDYKSVRKAYESVAGGHGNGKRKKWLIDFDYINPKVGISSEEIIKFNIIKKMVIQLQFEANQEPFTLTVPTKNGVHIITNPFNVQKFKEKYPELIVHKNNPTILAMS
jgi:hypothetical protein